MKKTHPFFEGLRPTLHIAHRGGAALAPENTMAAFRRAVEVDRTDMLELDVHLTRDGEIVVFHDDTLDRCTDGEGLVRERTWAELERLDAGFHFTPDGGRTFPFRGKGVRIPRLVEALRAWPDLRFNIELKRDEPGIVDAFADLIRRERVIGRACVGSEDDRLSRRLVDALPDACHFYPSGLLAYFVRAVKTGEPPPEAPPAYRVLDAPLDYAGIRVVDAPFLEAAAHQGLWVNVWTVDDPLEMRALVHLGVGGIMTDRPDLLRAVLDAA